MSAIPTVRVLIPLAKDPMSRRWSPPVYVCRSCKLNDWLWEAKGRPMCTCPPVVENMPADDLACEELALEDWLSTLYADA